MKLFSSIANILILLEAILASSNEIKHIENQAKFNGELMRKKQDDNNNGFGDNGLNSFYCGIRSLNRVIGGKDTNGVKHPWLVAIASKKNQTSYEIHCGGTLISDRFILTAAHCILKTVEQFNKDFDIVLGQYDLSKLSSTAKIMKISNYSIHQNFSITKADNDIAMIKLNDRLNFTETIKPICLPPKNLSPITNKELTVAGWGAFINYFGDISKVSREVNVTVMSNEKCQHRYNFLMIKLTDNQLCAGAKGKDACRGDSGGPLMLEQTGDQQMQTLLIGIVSFGGFCSSPLFPAIYTRVSHYIDWIDDTINNMNKNNII